MRTDSNKDTIAAIATPIGQAGIGIVRISGPRALEIAERVFRPKGATRRLQSHRLYLGQIIDPVSGRMIDEVLLSFMKAPHSYTREDVVEINSHSGYILLSTLLQMILNEGARLANPGEFTFRAFINGRIDLTQAEAIVDLINSRSEKGLQLASEQIRGEFKVQIETLRQKAIEIVAQMEVAIDFPEEEDGQLSREEMAGRIEKDLLKPIERLLAAHAQRRLWMEGVQTVIVGRVNAGKSSLLNRLLNEQRAIVTPIPGTTRDIIESTIHIDGLPIRLMDTAGLRKVRGEVERRGVDLTREKFSAADLSLIVIDQSRPLNQDDMEIIAQAEKQKSMIVLNKIDLRPVLSEKTLRRISNGMEVVKISALTGEGIDALRVAIRDHLVKGVTDIPGPRVAPNLRHRTALMEASVNLQNALHNVKKGLPPEVVAFDLNCALQALGEIIGETAREEIIEKIFSEFCIGK